MVFLTPKVILLLHLSAILVGNEEAMLYIRYGPGRASGTSGYGS